MVRRKRRVESVEYVHVLDFKEADWSGRCTWERYSAWKVERDRVFEGVKRSGTGVALEMVRAHRRVRHAVEMGHVSCGVCESERRRVREVAAPRYPRGWAHAEGETVEQL